MSGYIVDLETKTISNGNFREVLFTAPHSQLVVMCLQPGEEIGSESHQDHDQFFRIEEGVGTMVIAGEAQEIQAGSAVVVPAGETHNLVNTGNTALKLYTIYSPAQHPQGTIHKTKADAAD